jgi:radical SAM superfamily enzyme YgiQ (UPF0313 family)
MKIALLAMSGVRVKSDELRALGVSLPGFLERGQVIASLPSLGLLTLGGCTEEDVELGYFEHGDIQPEELVSRGFDLVAVSTFTAQALEAYEFTDRCRALGLPVAMGGLHVSMLPDEARDHADHVLLGDGEIVWPELLSDLRRGSARPLYDGRGRDFPLEKAPLPRYDLLDPERYNRITLQTTRSCPHACTFCASGVLLRGAYRKKPLDLVRRDLDAITSIWPRPFIELADDNTFVDKEWGKELLRAFLPYGLRWFTETDISVAEDEELLDLLRESGCRQVLIGLEDVDSRVVAELEDRPFKAGRVETAARAIRKIQEHGVSVNGCFVLGADHQDGATFRRIARFARDTGLAEVQVTLLTPFPGTPLRRRLAAEGRLLPGVDWGHYTLFDATFQPRLLTVRELEEGLAWLFQELYSAERVRERRRAFYSQSRQGARRRKRNGAKGILRTG